MKIGSISNNSRNEINPIIANTKKKISKTESFKSQLEKVGESNYEKKLAELTEDIIKQGNIITQKCDIKELKRYKEMIANFFNEVMDNGFSFDKQRTFDGKGRQRIYANIRKVDEHLDNLTTELMKNQTNQLTILQSVEDIRGLILDTLM